MSVATRQLQQFVAVAEALSFRKAAQRLHMSQPPLSQAIRRLELMLGTRLLLRTKSTVSLTAAGEVFLEEARRTLQRAQDMIDATRRAALGTHGRLRASYVPSASFGIVPAAVLEFRRRYPEVQLELYSETTSRQVDGLRENRTDVGILVPPLHDAEEIGVTPLQRERLVAAIPADHPLAARKSVRLRQLARDPFILFPLPQGPAFLNAILSACRRAGFFPRVVQEAPQMQTIVTLVACGMGVSIVPASMRAVHQDNVRYLEIRERVRPGYELAAASLKLARNPAIARFVEVARSVALASRPGA